MWKRLQKRQLRGLKFRRQYGVGRYVVDFYCPQLRLAIEIDGSNHFVGNRPEYDRRRDEFMANLDMTIVRIPSLEVCNDPDQVIEWLGELIGTTPVLSARLPKPPLLR